MHQTAAHDNLDLLYSNFYKYSVNIIGDTVPLAEEMNEVFAPFYDDEIRHMRLDTLTARIVKANERVEDNIKRGFEGLDIDGMLSLDNESIDYIRQFNVDYAKYIRTRAGRGDVSFVFTSSRSYKIPGTDISLGALKAYPASPFLTVDLSEKIARDISSTIDKFRNEYRIRSYERTGYITDNMVYREEG